MTKTFYYILLGYLSGSVLYARVFSTLMGKDILARSKDNNPGASNAFQYGGFLCGLGTLLGDLCKGFVPVWLYLHSEDAEGSHLALALILAAPVVGHAFPVFYRFRGGKGIAVTFGVLCGLFPAWQPFIIFAGAFLFFSLVVRITPHFQRTIAAYLSAMVCLLLTSQPKAVELGFSLVTAVVCLRLHKSKEPREAMEVKLL